MRKVKGYLAACYRGFAGDGASTEEIEANIQKAREVGWSIQEAFPDLDLFIPHIDEKITHKLWVAGLVTSDDIIDACCDLIDEETELLIILEPMSAGVKREIHRAMECVRQIEVVQVDEWNDYTKERIARAIHLILSRNDEK